MLCRPGSSDPIVRAEATSPAQTVKQLGVLSLLAQMRILILLGQHTYIHTGKRMRNTKSGEHTCVCLSTIAEFIELSMNSQTLQYLQYHFGGIIYSSFLTAILNLKEITFKYCLPCFASPHLLFSTCGSWTVGSKGLRGENGEKWGWQAEQTPGHKGMDAG